VTDIKFSDVFGKVWRFKVCGGVNCRVRGKIFVAVRPGNGEHFLGRVRDTPSNTEDGLWLISYRQWELDEAEEVTDHSLLDSFATEPDRGDEGK